MLKDILASQLHEKMQGAGTIQDLIHKAHTKTSPKAKAQIVAGRILPNHHWLRLAHFGHSQSDRVPVAPIPH